MLNKESGIRRATIISSAVNYFGFIVAAINIYFFININYFTPEQYGLTRLFLDLSASVFHFSCFGYLNTFYKFSPLYRKNYPKASNTELLKHLFFVSHLGFFVLLILGYIFQSNIAAYFSKKSILFNQYFYWFIPFAWGTILLSIAENYFYTTNQAVVSSIFKEIISRALVLILIVLFVFNLYDVDTFLKMFSLSTLFSVVILLLYYFKYYSLPKSEWFSILSKRLKKRLIYFSLFSYGAILIFSISTIIDSFFLATISKGGLRDMGIFTLATFIISLMQVPHKYLNNISRLKIFEAFQEKNIKQIQKIYYRSSLNLFIFGLLVLCCALLGFDNLFQVFPLNPVYKEAKIAILILGISKLFDMLTSVNYDIMVGSKHWRFDLYSNIILIILCIPMNYFLIKEYGILGAAITNLFLFAFLNTLRCVFIWIKLKMHPLGINMLWVFLISLALFFGFSTIGNFFYGWTALLFKCFGFSILFIFSIYIFKLTPDLEIVLITLKNRLSKIRNKK